MLFGEQLIVHSAHETRTAQMGFQRLKSYFENYDDLRRKVVEYRFCDCPGVHPVAERSGDQVRVPQQVGDPRFQRGLFVVG